jgi:uncharacterized Zn finger protein
MKLTFAMEHCKKCGGKPELLAEEGSSSHEGADVYQVRCAQCGPLDPLIWHDWYTEALVDWNEEQRRK